MLRFSMGKERYSGSVWHNTNTILSCSLMSTDKEMMQKSENIKVSTSFLKKNLD